MTLKILIFFKGFQGYMAVAVQNLNLEHLWVIYPGNQEYTLDERITVIPVTAVSPDGEDSKARRIKVCVLSATNPPRICLPL